MIVALFHLIFIIVTLTAMLLEMMLAIADAIAVTLLLLRAIVIDARRCARCFTVTSARH